MTDQILTGKTCLITGGGGGLGKAIATKCLEAGGSVIICDINEERLQQTSAELSSKGPLKTIKADIADKDEVQRLFDESIRAFGKIDVLVNNAAIMDQFEPVGDQPIEQYERVMAINLTAPFLLTRLAVRNMLEQPTPDGRVINIVSVAGKAGWAGGMSMHFSYGVLPSSNLSCYRCCLYRQQTWPGRLDQEYCFILWQQGHPLQRHDDGRHGYEYRRCIQDGHSHGRIPEDEGLV